MLSSSRTRHSDHRAGRDGGPIRGGDRGLRGDSKEDWLSAVFHADPAFPDMLDDLKCDTTELRRHGVRELRGAEAGPQDMSVRMVKAAEAKAQPVSLKARARTGKLNKGEVSICAQCNGYLGQRLPSWSTTNTSTILDPATVGLEYCTCELDISSYISSGVATLDSRIREVCRELGMKRNGESFAKYLNGKKTMPAKTRSYMNLDHSFDHLLTLPPGRGRNRYRLHLAHHGEIEEGVREIARLLVLKGHAAQLEDNVAGSSSGVA